jgi:hypothetical protein
MRWYKAAQTDNGELMGREQRRLAEDLDILRREAASGGPSDVLPRWKGEIRRMILLLPSKEAMLRMSMMELKDLSSKISDIRGLMEKFSASKLRGVTGAD